MKRIEMKKKKMSGLVGKIESKIYLGNKTKMKPSKLVLFMHHRN